MKSTRFAVLAVALFVPLELRGAILSTATNPANGHTYYLLDNSTWTAAEAEAITLGGHLATVRNAAEQLWLRDTFSPSHNRHLWIGLNDAEVEGTFVWTSGEPITYTNWGLNEPDNFSGMEDYVYIDAAHDGNWNDLRNLLEQPVPSGSLIPLQGVVEVVPEPTTWTLIAPILFFWYRLWYTNRHRRGGNRATDCSKIAPRQRRTCNG